MTFMDPSLVSYPKTIGYIHLSQTLCQNVSPTSPYEHLYFPSLRISDREKYFLQTVRLWLLENTDGSRVGISGLYVALGKIVWVV